MACIKKEISGKEVFFYTKFIFLLFLVFFIVRPTTIVFAQTANNDEINFITPDTNIEIPGVSFTTDETLLKQSTIETDGRTFIQIPFLGEYLAGLYRYAVGVAGAVAVIMIVVAGFQWTTSGGSPDVIGTAKERITNAITGLLLILCSYALLYAINPELVRFRALSIPYIGAKDVTTIKLIGNDAYYRLTGQQPRAPQLNYTEAIATGKRLNISDPCVMYTIVAAESRGRSDAIGYDTNYRGDKLVRARMKFLLSGRTYTGATFTPPVDSENAYNPRVHNKVNQINDDVFNASLPPDYGLDWREGFTHGFGVGQITLSSSDRCPNGERGRSVVPGAPCRTIPELLNAATNVEDAATLMATNLQLAYDAGFRDQREIVAAAFRAYNAGPGKIRNTPIGTILEDAYVQTNMSFYDSCKASGAPSAGN